MPYDTCLEVLVLATVLSSCLLYSLAFVFLGFLWWIVGYIIDLDIYFRFVSFFHNCSHQALPDGKASGPIGPCE